MGNVDNLILMLVMFKYLFNVQEKEGCKVILEYLIQMQQMIDDLVVEEGKIVDEYLVQLVFEFEGVDGEDEVVDGDGDVDVGIEVVVDVVDVVDVLVVDVILADVDVQFKG